MLSEPTCEWCCHSSMTQMSSEAISLVSHLWVMPPQWGFCKSATISRPHKLRTGSSNRKVHWRLWNPRTSIFFGQCPSLVLNTVCREGATIRVLCHLNDWPSLWQWVPQVSYPLYKEVFCLTALNAADLNASWWQLHVESFVVFWRVSCFIVIRESC